MLPRRSASPLALRTPPRDDTQAMTNEDLYGAIMSLKDATEAGFLRVDARIDRLECRFDGLERRFDGLERRFDGLEGRFGRLETRVEHIETDVGEIKRRLTGLETRR